MSEKTFEKCPRCGEMIEVGFFNRANGLSFASPESFEKFNFLDEDVSEAGLRKIIPSKAEWYQSYLCRSCKLYIVDYSSSFDRKESNEIAKELE